VKRKEGNLATTAKRQTRDDYLALVLEFPLTSSSRAVPAGRSTNWWGRISGPGAGQRDYDQPRRPRLSVHRAPAGVGKTSTARIFAKCLNCQDGPTPTLLAGKCDICQHRSGDDVDVLEIDGASNRGIDEIRQLRSNVNVRPSRSRFKIYIIDEVHMLTVAAFNALLKTLEEPPEHVKFIFCTTDRKRSRSRCCRAASGSISPRCRRIRSSSGCGSSSRGGRRGRRRGAAAAGPPRRRLDAGQPVAAGATAVILRRARSRKTTSTRCWGPPGLRRVDAATRSERFPSS
jgi:hypothetical protein